MAKRKRASSSPSPTPSSSPDPAERTLKSQKRSCNRCLITAKKALTVALRLGAGFERQKHSRRKKTAQAQKNDKALERLNAEYLVLKGLELEKVADQHLRKTVGKIKSLKDQEALREYVAGLEKGSTDSATLNVLARLCKVAAVKKVVDEAVDELKGIFSAGEEAAQAQNNDKTESKKQKTAKKGVDRDEDIIDVDDGEDDTFAAFDARIAAPSSGEDDSEGSISDDERPPSIRDSESDHDPEDDLQAESESDEEEVFEGFSGEEDSASGDEDVVINRRIAPPSDISDSDHSSNDASIPTSKTKSKAPAAIVPSSSAFLPSLSNTYVAGSDSDASDLDAEFAPRKNRRGQRARQKIAEAKFGAKAKHLEKQDRNNGWDPKRGAVSNDRVRRGYGPQQSGENAIPLGKKKGEGKKRDDKGTLHPSWQAAKMAKEKKMIKIDVKAGAGKKVIFD